ncbi:MAG: response regulator transcription factor [Clostridiales Family XIII bacterium]|jgi:DNA-binding response OmpR family regulator|nr:response regulator transcription factor [Clostridiales Family XIII bacterium]
MKVLIVEDEKRLAEALAQILKRNNFDVDVSFDGEEGLDNALSGVYDVILLDILLPGMDGLSVLKELRAEAIPTPVILLTALGEVEDRVKGLDLGADDYLPKPFKTEELIARIKAVTRRRGEFHADGILSFGDIELNPLAMTLYREGKSYALTQKESNLLEYLLQNTNIRLSSDSIIEKVWGYDSDAEDGNVQAYMSFLRKKLAALGSAVKIGNLRGAGYMLEYEGAESGGAKKTS